MSLWFQHEFALWAVRFRSKQSKGNGPREQGKNGVGSMNSHHLWWLLPTIIGKCVPNGTYHNLHLSAKLLLFCWPTERTARSRATKVGRFFGKRIRVWRAGSLTHSLTHWLYDLRYGTHICPRKPYITRVGRLRIDSAERRGSEALRRFGRASKVSDWLTVGAVDVGEPLFS